MMVWSASADEFLARHARQTTCAAATVADQSSASRPLPPRAPAASAIIQGAHARGRHTGLSEPHRCLCIGDGGRRGRLETLRGGGQHEITQIEDFMVDLLPICNIFHLVTSTFAIVSLFRPTFPRSFYSTCSCFSCVCVPARVCARMRVMESMTGREDCVSRRFIWRRLGLEMSLHLAKPPVRSRKMNLRL
jgi:hypothetical protein